MDENQVVSFSTISSYAANPKFSIERLQCRTLLRGQVSIAGSKQENRSLTAPLTQLKPNVHSLNTFGEYGGAHLRSINLWAIQMCKHYECCHLVELC